MPRIGYAQIGGTHIVDLSTGFRVIDRKSPGHWAAINTDLWGYYATRWATYRIFRNSRPGGSPG